MSVNPATLFSEENLLLYGYKPPIDPEKEEQRKAAAKEHREQKEKQKTERIKAQD